MGRAMGRGGRCMKPNGYRDWDGGTAATPMGGAPLAERAKRSARHDSRAVFFDTALPLLSAPFRTTKVFVVFELWLVRKIQA